MSDLIQTTELDSEQQLKIDEILPKLNSLKELLETEDPDIKHWTTMINNDLRQYPELLYLLSDEQIAPIYQAYKVQTGVAIATKKEKSRKASRLLDNGQTAGDLL